MSHTDKLRFRGRRLLIIDDQASSLATFQHVFTEAGFDVSTLLAVNGTQPNPHADHFDGVFHNAEEFRAWVATHPVDAFLTDNQMLTPRTGERTPYFWGEDATKVFLEEKPGRPALMHSNAYNEMRGRENVAEALAHDTAQYRTIGGHAVFAKRDMAILDSLDEALQAMRRR